MKLKTNKTFTKEIRTKIKNQKNKDKSCNINNKEDHSEIFRVRREEKKIKKKALLTGNRPPQLTCVTLTERGCDYESNNTIKGFFGHEKWCIHHLKCPISSYASLEV
jgi:hypothetical protein